MKHTPAPWRQCIDWNATQNIGIWHQTPDPRGQESIHIATVFESSRIAYTQAEQQANAHLIAAAPDILAALEAALDTLNEIAGIEVATPRQANEDAHDWAMRTLRDAILAACGPLSAVRTAIGKAKGKTP